MSKLYAQFDEINIGASLALSFGDQIVQTSASVDAHRIARSSIAMSIFRGQMECYVYSPDAGTPSMVSVSGVPPIAMGIVQSTDSLSKFVGEDTNGYGYCPGDGKVYHNNAVVTTLGTCPLNTYVGVIVDPVAGLLTITANGQPLGSISIATGQTWYCACTVSGNPGDLGIWANWGQTPLRYVAPQIGGWWIPSPTINPINVAVEPYLTEPTDTPPNLRFYGDIDRATQPLKMERGVVIWPWGTSMPPMMGKSNTQAQLRLFDPFNKYSELMTQDVRDQIVSISRLYQDTSYSTLEQCFSMIIDHVIQDTDQSKVLYLTDISALLQVPLNRSLFPPNADPSVAGKPRPVSIGICRNYTPDLFDTTNLYYEAHDSPLSALGTLRIAGKPITLGTDYNMLPDSSGFQLVTATGSKFTAESTATGAVYNPLGTDMLSGSGNFLSATPDGSGHPTGWLTYYSGISVSSYWQVNATYGVQTPASVYSFQTIVRDPGSFSIAAGQSYIVQINVTQIPDFGSVTNGSGTFYVDPATLVVGTASGQTARGFQIIGASIQLTRTGTYTVIVINNLPFTTTFGMQLQMNNLIQVGNWFSIGSVELQVLPNILDNVALSGPGLNDMITAIAIDRGPMTAAQYSSADAIAIDTATGYSYGIHHDSNEQPQVQADLKTLLDSVSSDYYTGRDGLIHIFRLIAPETVSGGSIAGYLTVTDFLTYLEPWPDQAENLTSRINGACNYTVYTDGDFGTTSLTDCPVQVRAKLKQSYQWTAPSGVQLAPRYSPYATSAQPLNSLFDVYAHGQAEITHIGTLYSQPRNFYVGTVFSQIGRQFEIGQVWNVTYPIGTLIAGQNLIVVHIGDSPSEETTEVVFWGL